MTRRKKRKLTQEKVDAINRKLDLRHSPDDCDGWMRTSSRYILDQDGRTVEVISCRSRRT